MRRHFFALLFVSSLSCGGLAEQGAALPEGLWGGSQIRLTVTATGADLELGCAGGQITDRIAPDSAGRFVAHGNFKVEEPGATVQNDRPGQDARYSGTVHGDVMELKVEMAGQDARSFHLVRGKRTRVTRCAHVRERD
jgi:hypothetical protein